MKKKAAIVFILLLFFIYAQAQKTERGAKAGFFVGILGSQVDGDNLSGYK
jgi:hypothetical protein